MSTGRESLSPFDFAGLTSIWRLTHIFNIMKEIIKNYVHFWVQFLSQESSIIRNFNLEENLLSQHQFIMATELP